MDGAQQGREQAGAHHQHAALAADVVDQPGDARDLGIERVGRQIEHGEFHRDRRVDVFRGDLLRLVAHAPLQHARGAALRLDIARLRGGQQALVVLHRELGIDRQQRADLAAHRHLHRELDRVVALRADLAVRFVLADR